MKILCVEYNQLDEPGIFPVGDDVLLRNNDDFYLPDFTSRLSCVPQFVVRLCKLGKYVGQRFADRYYEEVGLGIRFYADDLEDRLIEKRLPCTIASSFAGSAAISSLLPRAECNNFSFVVNGEVIYKYELMDMPKDINSLITLASEYYMLKIGDFLYCGNPFRYHGLCQGDHLQMLVGQQCLMDFKIK